MVKILKSLIFLSVLWGSLPIFASTKAQQSLFYFRSGQTPAEWAALTAQLKSINAHLASTSQAEKTNKETIEVKAYNDAAHNDAVRSLIKTAFGIEIAKQQMPFITQVDHFYVICVNHKFAGFIAYALHNKMKASITSIAIKEEYRRKKLGTQLLNYTKANLKKLKYSTVELLATINSIPLYERNGFLPVFGRPNYYSLKLT